METYGKANQLTYTFRLIKNRFKLNKHQKVIMKNNNIDGFITKLNKYKLAIGVVLTGLCLFSVGTNWLIFFIVPWSLG